MIYKKLIKPINQKAVIVNKQGVEYTFKTPLNETNDVVSLEQSFLDDINGTRTDLDSLSTEFEDFTTVVNLEVNNIKQEQTTQNNSINRNETDITTLKNDLGDLGDIVNQNTNNINNLNDMFVKEVNEIKANYDINLYEKKISNVGNPVYNSDCVNKLYVDNAGVKKLVVPVSSLRYSNAFSNNGVRTKIYNYKPTINANRIINITWNQTNSMWLYHNWQILSEYDINIYFIRPDSGNDFTPTDEIIIWYI